MTRVVHRPAVAPSRVQQSGVREANAQHIIDQATRRRGPLPSGSRVPQGIVMPSVDDLYAALEVTGRANAVWGCLSPQLRSRFGNSMSEFAAALDDPDRQEDLVKYGIREKLPRMAAPAAPPADPPVPPPPPVKEEA